MARQEKHVKRRLQASALSTIVSISLVLFMLGIVGLILLTSEKLSVIVKENIGFSVYLKENAKEVDIIQIQKGLDASDYVKETEYITKEEAVKILRKDLDPEEDFINFLDGYNPLPPSIDVVLKAQYANQDSIAWIEKELTKSEIVKEVVYSKSLVHLINENVKKPTDYVQINHEQLKIDCMEWGLTTTEIENLRRVTPEVVQTEGGAWHSDYEFLYPANEANQANFNYCFDVAINFGSFK